MADVINLDDNRPHVVHEVICVQCCHRWIACAPALLSLKDYECGDCGFGYVIKTGQDLTIN